VNLRAQDGSRREGGRRQYGFYDASVTDLGCALDYILVHTETRADRVDGVGCSLGGSYIFVYLAVMKEKSRLGSVVAMGAPLRWVEIHPVLKAVFSSPRLMGQVRFRGTRLLAKAGLPVLKKIPKLLHLYMHPEIVNTSKMNEMIQTVEDPNPILNRQIAEWICSGDLHVNGINVTEGVTAARNPLMIVLANADGIVPDATALSAYEMMGSSIKDTLRVGTAAVPVAHADLFVSEISQEWVFEPLSQWLLEQNDLPQPSPTKTRGAKKARAGAKGSKKRKPAVKKKAAAARAGNKG